MSSSAHDVRSYVEVISRLGRLFSLASLLPVITECRFRWVRTPQRRPAQAAPKQEDKQQEQQEEPADEPPANLAPVGMPSFALLLLAELSWCYELFLPVPRKKAGDPKAARLMPALLQGIQNATVAAQPWQKVGGSKGMRASKQGSSGFVGQAIAAVTSALATADAFTAVHGLAILAALTSAFAFVAYLTLSDSKGIQGITKVFHNLLVGAFVALPVVTFCGTNVELLTKAWKALVSDKLAGTFHLPLKILGLIFAMPPGGEDGEDERLSTPGMFSALQAASLTASLSAEIASGSLGLAIQELQRSPSLSTIYDSELCSFAIPVAIGLAWLTLVHLQRRPLSLMVCMLLTVVTSPLVIVSSWPKAGGLLGLGAYDAVGPEPLLPVISVAYVLVLALICFSGGGLGLGMTMVLSQALIRVHGLEAFGLA